MKIESIFELWKEDSQIDKTEVADETAKIPKLHDKYYKIFIGERILLRQIESDFKKLKFSKYEFYSQGPNGEDYQKNWKMPSKGLILKADIPMYIDSDNDIIEASLKIGIQQEKVELLDSIIKSINNRGYLMSTILGWHKFTSGG